MVDVRIEEPDNNFTGTEDQRKAFLVRPICAACSRRNRSSLLFERFLSCGSRSSGVDKSGSASLLRA